VTISSSGVPLTPSDEQAAIIERAAAGDSFKIVAFAGTGKTTTIEMLAAALAPKSVLYLVFNKAAQREAEARFAAQPHVKTMTANALAYATLARSDRSRLQNDNLTAEYVWQQFMLERGALAKFDEKKRVRAARTVIGAYKAFLISNEPVVQPQHVPLNGFDSEHIASLARRLAASIAQVTQLPITHDVYFKWYALSDPAMGADVVVLDEAQDLSAVMVGAIERQNEVQTIYCGDPHQQLYEFRGAINALQQILLPSMPLTETRRFGPAIALAANRILEVKGEPGRIVGISNDPGATYGGFAEAPDVVLSRTNLGLIEAALRAIDRHSRIFIRGATGRNGRAGNGAGELMQSVLAAYDLFQGRRSTQAMFGRFESWDDLREASNEDGGKQLSPFVRAVEKYKANVPRVVAQIRDSSTPIEAEADLVLSTTHRFKGEEADVVELGSDFSDIVNEIDDLVVSEAAIAYVAVTRAKSQLYYGGALEMLTASLKRVGLQVPLTPRALAPLPPLRGAAAAPPPPRRSYQHLTPDSVWMYPAYGMVTVVDATHQLVTIRTGEGKELKLGTLIALPKFTPPGSSE
jgi:superfamily I DNA/RNA helicase